MSPNRSIAHYRIGAKLGEGGMGEVWRATDTKLGRDVAIKILPDAFAADADRMARFEREAQVLASLNHPNIAAIYGVEDQALVIELVEGPTLAQRIAGGPIPLDEALEIARQLADALETAHEKGVIHRDLKPANLKVTADGRLKVLDFGLAKAIAGDGLSAESANSPTITMAATVAGVILGTAAYMAPEQARGATVDKRADIWSFGCVLFEMLTGRQTFQGGSTTDILAAVLRVEPDWSALPDATPPAIRRLLRRCLTKDRKRRLPDIAVVRLEIDDALAPAEPAAAAPQPKRRKLPWLVAGTAVLAAAAAWWAPRAASQDVWNGVLLGGPAQSFSPRLSPDGQLLAFLAFIDQLPQLAVMKPNGGSWTMLTRDRDHGYIATIAWARDGSKIYFDRLWGHPLGVYSIPPLGGEPRLLLEDAYGPEPLPDGSLIAAKLADRGDAQFYRFWPDTGKLETLPAYMKQNDIAPMMRAFPDGKEMVFYGRASANRAQTDRLMILDLESGHSRELPLPAGAHLPQEGTWAPLDVSPDGESVYVVVAEADSKLLVKLPRSGAAKPQPVLPFPSSVSAVAVDVAADGSLYTDQMLFLRSVLRFPASGGAPEDFAIPPTKSVKTLPGGDALLTLTSWGKQRVATLRPGGGPHVVLESGEESSEPATTFGNSIAFVAGSGDSQRIAVASLRDGRIARRYASTADRSISASPDGKTLYYAHSGAIWAQPVSGGDAARITEGIEVAIDPAGRYLYVKRSRNIGWFLVRTPVGGGPEEELKIPPQFHIADPALSPAAIDARGRVLLTVATPDSFYYRTAILDPAGKTFAVVPVAVDGDVSVAGWTPDGRIVASGTRYLTTLWRYQRSKSYR